MMRNPAVAAIELASTDGREFTDKYDGIRQGLTRACAEESRFTGQQDDANLGTLRWRKFGQLGAFGS